MAQGGGDLEISTEYGEEIRKQVPEEKSGSGFSFGFGLGDKVSTTWQSLTGVPKSVMQAVKKPLSNSKKPLPTVDISEDFKDDFMSTCKAVGDRLLTKLPKADFTWSDTEIHQMIETGRQLEKKEILISVVGRFNAGKSTLLNALLGAKLLPMNWKSETSLKVYIHHDVGDSCVDPEATPDQPPKLVLKKEKQVPPVEVTVVGATEIYKKLETLNEEVRNRAEEVSCTIKTNVPLLASTPPNWQVRLVDTPGTGDSNSHITETAEGALKSSSAYVFITTCNDITSQKNADVISFLWEHDQGVFEDKRFIIVVTKCEGITAEEVQEEVLKFFHGKLPKVTISRDDVLPLSGMWAYNARMLMNHPEHENHRAEVVSCLSQYQSLPSGQGESRSLCLTARCDDELAKQLLDCSRIASLEARIHNMTKSCMKIWVSEMRGTYVSYLKDAREKLWNLLPSELQQQKENEEERSHVQKCLDVIDEQRRQLEENMKSKVSADLGRKYPDDVKVSGTLETSKDMILMKMKKFREKCIKKVEEEDVTFGPDELNKELEEFLKEMSTELERIFNSTCAFTGLNEIFLDHVSKVAKVVTVMRGNVELLSTPQGQRPAFESIEIRKEKASEEEGSSDQHMAPNLGLIKDRVNIPSVNLAWWALLWEIIKPFPSPVCDRLQYANTEGEDLGDMVTCSDFRKWIKSDVLDSVDAEPEGAMPSQPSSYRSWNKELKATMNKMEVHLTEECDAYFANIKHHILQYFLNQYRRETGAWLNAFDVDCKAQIGEGRRQLQKLNKSLENTDLKMYELFQLCLELEKLTSHLNRKADDYISSIGK